MWNRTSPGFKFHPRLNLWKDGKNNVFNPYTLEATSYNWWIYLKKIKGKLVFNTYPYSKTKQRHQNHMHKLLKELNIKIDVKVSTRQSLHNFSNSALYAKYENLFRLELFGPRKKRYNEEDHKKDIEEVKKSIKVLRSIGCKMSRQDMKQLKQNIIEHDLERKVEARKERLRVKELKAKLMPDLMSTSPLNFFSKEMSSLEPITLTKGK